MTLTDKSTLLKLLENNIAKNLTEEERKRTTAKELFWGSGNPFSEAIDFIIGADLTYDFEDLPILVQTLKELSSDTTITYIAYGKERAASTHYSMTVNFVAPKFLELVEESFNVTQLDDFEIGGTVDPMPWSTHSIGIVQLKKKAL